MLRILRANVCSNCACYRKKRLETGKYRFELKVGNVERYREEETWDQSTHHGLQEVHEEVLVCRYQTMSFLFGQPLDD